MKREIKFRGKSLHTGEWHYGDFVQHSDNTVFIRERGTASSLSNPETVGQFTGLHDNNGNEIYEGDIVRYDMGGECEVSYCIGGGFAGFDLSPAFHNEHQLKDVEVIGNIHDNPELIEGGIE
jgi:uncharacterized phage protein (TIGR01671 family)